MEHDEMTEQEKNEFALAFTTVLTYINNFFDGQLHGVIGLVCKEDSSRNMDFHIEIHDASYCACDDEHTCLVNAPSSGSLQ